MSHLSVNAEPSVVGAPQAASLVPELSVVVPVHNESANVGPLIAEIRSVLADFGEYEIIYVDDASSDDTCRVLQTIRQDCDRLRIVRHLNNCGQSTAVRTGVKAARAAWVVTLDGDGQNDPADIPKLWAQRPQILDLSVPHVICGHRQVRRDSAIKQVSSRLANAIRAALLKDNTPDTGCGIKLFPRQAFLDLPYFDHMHRFLPALFLRAGGRVISVAVNHRHRTRGKSHYGTLGRLWVGIFDLIGVAWLQRRMQRPVLEGDGSEN
ncbi:MAG: glycosyltransferase family 2 protein [Desulfobulbaceae bacterium]|nr:glycosyltransferase family 2 protein [Desulfobulbaceae bacterium]